MNWTLVSTILILGVLVEGCRASRSSSSSTSVSCRNEQGHAVDWYILYKQPNLDGENGLRYLYMDEKTGGWIPARYTIDDKRSAVAQTLRPFFNNYAAQSDSFGYILYNDQPPEPFHTAASSYGHSKGVVLLDKRTGVWLSHSTPDFPGFDIDAFWPDSGYHNGQTFICGTYAYAAFKEIALQLGYIHVYPFSSFIPASFHSELQCVARKGCYPHQSPWDRHVTLTTVGGHQFVSYAKYGKMHDDLYSAVLDQPMGGDFYVKGWGRLRHPLLSNCSVPNLVYNVESVQLPTTDAFSVTVDHSKWCVTVEEGAQAWTCIADMNREVSQESRGGGAICTHHPAVWRAFSSLVFTYEPCPV